MSVLNTEIKAVCVYVCAYKSCDYLEGHPEVLSSDCFASVSQMHYCFLHFQFLSIPTAMFSHVCMHLYIVWELKRTEGIFTCQNDRTVH